MYVYPANVLLPTPDKTDLGKWAVLACDQHTSEPEYWEELRKNIGDSPSTLSLMLPEVWLGEADTRVPEIHNAMRRYLEDGIFEEHKECGIYTERTLADGSVRRGLVACIDLEDYDYSEGSISLVRATEKTVVERIPPRLAVRRGAPIEMPHVMLLADDEENILFGSFAGNAADAYDFELNCGGGGIRGAFVKKEEFEYINEACEKLKNKRGGASPILFAVGDGNHSLATAKAAYEELKGCLGAEEAAVHPARYALCEIVNLHDDSLVFEPIYRIVRTPEPEKLASAFAEYAASRVGNGERRAFTAVYGETEREIVAPCPDVSLAVALLQRFLDDYIASHPECETDYIHGEDTLRSLARRDGYVGFLFEGMNKSELFGAVESDGALPRKTFSMGHAEDKRYYVECRRILP